MPLKEERIRPKDFPIAAFGKRMDEEVGKLLSAGFEFPISWSAVFLNGAIMSGYFFLDANGDGDCQIVSEYYPECEVSGYAHVLYVSAEGKAQKAKILIATNDQPDSWFDDLAND